ncbi:hypothetical protein GCM10007939_20840 [Amylibacter marinus]|uniref:GH16 domain-containing protein n=1 Tax=Amylibacter marinus TaxID=1475483 RepID=A0ABQ5VXL0_9RHOB|nr:family 16 glycosylhydrolase [Amylibacter marinus]GLQ35801.1 hypothetical protein GCM10007939_20840 [Amylibacter marinus]
MTLTLNDQTYVLTFQDDFDTARIWDGIGDGDIWATSYRPHQDDARNIAANGELQYYVDPDMTDFENPIAFNNGTAQITATPLTPAQSALANGAEYSSAILTSEMSFGFTYGYIEMRADIPAQTGFWSSLWLLPTSGEWTSEIDIFEIRGAEAGTIHTNYWQDQGGTMTPDADYTQNTDAGAGFHTYGLLWTEDTLQWFYDGTLIREASVTLDQEMQILLSLAVGGFGGDTDASTDYTDPYSIDYIRIYELESSDTRNDALTGDFISHDLKNGTNNSEELYGTRFDDTIKGRKGDDTLYGRSGADKLRGNKGEDSLFGGDGADNLGGGQDNDHLIGGAGADTLTGGKGTDHMWGGDYGADATTDTFVFSADSGTDYIHDFESDHDLVKLRHYENGNWDDLQLALSDQGWAVQIDLASLGGTTGDTLYLVGANMADLSTDNFIFVDPVLG